MNLIIDISLPNFCIKVVKMIILKKFVNNNLPKAISYIKIN